ncbi:MAG: ABC transporter ATP-binding protein/permease [marine benthic group bacterium]|nr:ABC transporter ATP-binding protein/permease [Gemmatimonadota bacterium]
MRGWGAVLTHDESQKPPKLTRELLLRIWSYARPYWGLVVASLVTILVSTAIGLVSPQLFRYMIDVAIPERDPGMVTWLAVGMMVVPILTGVIGVYQRRLNATIGEGLIFDLRRDLYAHLEAMSLRFFAQTRTGELMSRLNNDVQGAKNAINETVVTIVTNLIQVVATLAIMAAMEWRLTLLSVAVLPLFMLPARHFARVLRDLRRESLEHNAEMNATMNETLNVSGALLVKLFGRERMELDEFSRQAREVHDIGIRAAVTGRWFWMMLSVVTAIGIALVYLVGGHMVLAGTFTIGTIVAFGAYLRQLYGPLQSLTNAPVSFAQSMVSFERVFEVLDLPVEIGEEPDAVDLGRVEGRIEFREVFFDYEALEREGEVASLATVARYGRNADASMLLKRGKGGSRAERDEEVIEEAIESAPEQAPDQIDPRVPDRRWALDDVSFVIEPGQLAALVGPSGSGKTTTTYLIPRLYDPTLGEVRIDDIDIRQATLQSLADNIGMVTQETYLFYDTIRANLLYADPDASEERLVEAAKAANIHDFIASLPDGYDTVVGERGYRLSGGERQRMAIARVILSDPRILVLDEATSALDSISEALVQDALMHVMEGRTSLVIAHRLSTILSADTILVMQGGRLVEQGTHEELLARDGLYAELYETQFQSAMEGFEAAAGIDSGPA